jgi:heme O synthase-like polyprenyltransferase
MAIGSKLNIAGKYMTYVYSVIAIIIALASIVAGAQSMKEKEERKAMGYFGLAILVSLVVILNIIVARRMYGGRFLLGLEGVRFLT